MSWPGCSRPGSGRAPCPTWISAGWRTWRRPLSAERTNFRFNIRRNDTGVLIYSNLEGSAALEDHVHAVEQTELIVAQNSGVAGNDYMIWDSGRGYYLLNVVLPDGTVQLFLPEDVEQAAYYGYTLTGMTPGTTTRPRTAGNPVGAGPGVRRGRPSHRPG